MEKNPNITKPHYIIISLDFCYIKVLLYFHKNKGLEVMVVLCLDFILKGLAFKSRLESLCCVHGQGNNPNRTVLHPEHVLCLLNFWFYLTKFLVCN